MMRSVSRALMFVLLLAALLLGAQQLVAAFTHNLGALTVSRVGVSLTDAKSTADVAANIQTQLAERYLSFAARTSERHSLSGDRLLSALYLTVGRPDAAENAALRALAEAPSDRISYFCLGQALMQQGRQEEAIRAWQNANAASYFVQDAFHRHWAGDDAAALDAYRIAVAVDPLAAPTDLRVAMGWVYYDQGDKTAAETEFQGAVDQAARDTTIRDQAYALGEKGLYYMRVGQPDKAVSALSMSLALEPDSAHYQLWLGGAYRELKQFDLALAELIPLQATATGETLGFVYSSLGEIYLAQGRYQLAADMLKVAVKILPHNQEIPGALYLYTSTAVG